MGVIFTIEMPQINYILLAKEYKLFCHQIILSKSFAQKTKI